MKKIITVIFATIMASVAFSLETATIRITKKGGGVIENKVNLTI